ncbi:MAG: phosphoribosylanthranilate isomerase [Candidatus Tectomicrobia bacterium]|nr:phosphoribosylanthranilate isomerase [Candidatus Tectomicrobia bacterium]
MAPTETPKVKICGITNLYDALYAVEAGADALGFVFYEPVPRYIRPEEARRIISFLPPFLTTVGLFVNPTLARVKEIIEVAQVDAIQLHGEIDPEVVNMLGKRAIMAIRVKDEASLNMIPEEHVNAIHLDSYVEGLYGGTGHTFDWSLAIRAKAYGRIILAGGLTPDNVAAAVETVKPYGVDVSSGVEEKPGKKDHWKVREFIRRAKGIQ